MTPCPAEGQRGRYGEERRGGEPALLMLLRYNDTRHAAARGVRALL